MSYEKHKMKPSFPIIFHTQYVRRKTGYHWHENIEIINVINGEGVVMVGTNEVFVKKGDTVVINSCAVHQFFPKSLEFDYYCLIINIDLLEQFGVNIEKFTITDKFSDDEVNRLFNEIQSVYSSEEDYYEFEMLANSMKIIRNILNKYSYKKDLIHEHNEKSSLHISREVLLYMKKNMDKDITLEGISKHFGYNKYYLCRSFKDATGSTIIKMLNFMRCTEAKRLILKSGGDNINDIAVKCGYTNVSYFVRTYKNIIGCLPSQTKQFFS